MAHHRREICAANLWRLYTFALAKPIDFLFISNSIFLITYIKSIVIDKFIYQNTYIKSI